MAVVVPTLDEARALPGLLSDLAAQEDVELEIVLCDGGSRDGTREAAASFARSSSRPVRWVDTAPGRGRQMNAGAAAAGQPELLFLHADSRLEGRSQLAQAAAALAAARARRGDDRVAGHFGLRFRRASAGHETAYYYYEAKSCLDREDSVNGDQGMWLSSRFFAALGGFDESLPFMEDARLARKVSSAGEWVRLPGRLSTSARRFEAEGFWARQRLNALIRVCDAAGLEPFLREAPGLYRADRAAGTPLRSAPFLRLARSILRGLGPAGAAAAGLAAGRFIVGSGWQLAFALDCLGNRRAGRPPGNGPAAWLGRYERWLSRGAGERLGGAAAGLALLGAFFLWGAGEEAFARLGRGAKAGRPGS